MRATRHWLPAALVLGVSLLGSGCLLIPEIKEKIVELAVSGSTSAEFLADGLETDGVNEVDVVSIGDGTELDLRRILADAGVDVSDVVNVKVEKVEYAITRADPYAGRTVQGNLTVQRLGGTEQPLITGFVTNVDAVTGYQAASLQAAGVDELNQALASVLAQLQAGGTPTESATFRVTGTTTPGVDPLRSTNFQYSVKLTVSMVGTIRVDVPE